MTERACIPWRGEEVSRIILGTVQLGMPYGIANTAGQPDGDTACAILRTAWEGGIRHFDTAQTYGDSESVLGAALEAMGVSKEARVVSKLAASLDPEDIGQVAASIERSLNRLRMDSIWCLLFHRAEWLDHWDAGLGELLLGFRERGLVEHLGVSLLGPEEAERCLRHPAMEILQVAANAWDGRMRQGGLFDAARANGQLCCVRSVYLQGLLTMTPAQVAERLPVAHAASSAWHAVARETNLPPAELALRHALGLQAPLVVGAESPGQVAETLAWAEKGALPDETAEKLRAAMTPLVSPAILDPYRWPRPGAHPASNEAAEPK